MAEKILGIGNSEKKFLFFSFLCKMFASSMFDFLLLTCGQACLYKSPNVAREIICELININFHSHCFIGNESNYNCNTVLPFLIQQEDNLSQDCPSQIQKRCNPLHQDLARCMNVTFVPFSPPSLSSSVSNNGIKRPQRGFFNVLAFWAQYNYT